MVKRDKNEDILGRVQTLEQNEFSVEKELADIKETQKFISEEINQSKQILISVYKDITDIHKDIAGIHKTRETILWKFILTTCSGIVGSAITIILSIVFKMF